jgi:hypothetical protein
MNLGMKVLEESIASVFSPEDLRTSFHALQPRRVRSHCSVLMVFWCDVRRPSVSANIKRIPRLTLSVSHSVCVCPSIYSSSCVCFKEYLEVEICFISSSGW